MSDLRIVIYGDGEFELGEPGKEYSASDDLPALPRLVHRLISEPYRARFTCRLFRKVSGAHGKGDRFEKKTMQAIREAKQQGFHAIVIAVDRDGHPASERLHPLAKGRDCMAGLGFPPCVVGAAVETFDAWMIADGKAIGAAGGDASKSHTDPERLSGKEGSGQHPKDRAMVLFGGRDSLGERYSRVAAVLDLELLSRCCPAGFEPFAREVRERIVPLAVGN
jgi:hypothetical protein